MNYKHHLFKIRSLSNLHVGAGSENYGIIDNQVQRDVTTGLPIIHGSSLKGALREFFQHHNGQGSDLVNYIFGYEKDNESTSETTDKKSHTKGNYIFSDAELFSYPVRTDKNPYLSCISDKNIKSLKAKLRYFSLDNRISLKAYTAENNHVLEELDIITEKNNFKKWDGSYYYQLDHKRFKMLTDNNHLPVLARNKLTDGQSDNVWYEQVVPRYTEFLFTVHTAIDVDSHWVTFLSKLKDHLVQIGANASVGFGMCEIMHLSSAESNTNTKAA